MRRAERKLLLSINVTGDNILKDDNKELSEVGTGDLKSIIFGLHMFDPIEINDGNHKDMNIQEISAMADRVLAMRDEQILDKDERKFEVNPRNILKGDDVKEGVSASLSYGCDEQNMDGNVPKMVALAVVQFYNPRRKIPRGEISVPHLESCLSKAAFSAAQNSASIHMPRIGYQDGSDRSEWYTIERLLRKYASIYNINIYV
uniref:Uncharacterized protein n=1 Tax=Cajanus cajan TaxID=3821 RepID=A0A151U8I4_CAJCA|nr:hypothetical protein KK1_019801 [Cajanus cajan]